jgi:hypothetical protein
MNNLNYPLTNDITPIIRDYRANILLEKSGIVTPTIQREKKLGYTTNSKLGGKTKLILGFIYLFSLLFFTIKLFT